MVNKLKYQLTPDENDKLDDYWKFIKVFNVNNNFLYSPREYRHNLIKKIDFTTKLAYSIRDGSCINKQIMFIEENNIIFQEYRNLKTNVKVPQDI